jgi:hypothetical protein
VLLQVTGCRLGGFGGGFGWAGWCGLESLLGWESGGKVRISKVVKMAWFCGEVVWEKGLEEKEGCCG